ncbi:hypothetical protein BGM25_03620 [Bacillus sp. FJAT-29953]|nr:hypothetical protein [Bacillus sp. FJAT-29953]
MTKSRREQFLWRSCPAHRLYLLKQGFGFLRIVLELCADSGYQPQIDFETSNIETARSLVASGLGVTIVPKMILIHSIFRFNHTRLRQWYLLI